MSNYPKLDVLVFAAHPDDAELSCSGTIAKLIAQGKKVGIVDLTLGELSTRGNVELRKEEAQNASDILGISIRENLNLGDGWFEINQSSILSVIKAIRKYRPEIIIGNAISDRHIDHPKGAQLCEKAFFLSGLRKIEVLDDHQLLLAEWRPKHLFHYIQYDYIIPDFVVDITAYFEIKKQAILAFKSQFYDPQSQEPISVIATDIFKDSIEARAREMGGIIQKKYGEGFTYSRIPELDISNFLS